MKRPSFTLAQYYTLSNLVIGSAMLVFGILDFFSGAFVDFLDILLAIVIALTFIFSLVGKREETDEMAEAHKGRAYEDGFWAIIISLAVMGTVEHWGFAEVKILTENMIAMGAGFAVYGLSFLLREKYGDNDE